MSLDLEQIDLGGFGIGDDDDTQPEVNPQLRSNMDEAFKIDPDQHAKTTKLSEQSGVPEFAVESDPAKVEHNLKLDGIDFSEMSKRNPNTAKYLTDFNNSIIAQDDIDVMKSIEDTITSVVDYGSEIAAAFEKGGLIVESSEIGLNRMFAAINLGEAVSDEDIKRLKELDEKTKSPIDEHGFFVGAPITAAEQLPILTEVLLGSLKFAAIGTATGFVVGGATGVPGGPVTMSVTSKAGAKTGFKLGSRFGVAKTSFDLEAGLAFNEFSALKDEEGELLDPEIAGYSAATVGAINATLEFMSFKALGRTVTPLMKSIIRSKVKKAIATESGRQVVRRLGTNYAKFIATESVTEGLQEFSNIIGGELAKMFDSESFKEQDLDSVLDNIFSEKSFDRIVQAAEKGAQASLIFGGVTTSASAVAETRERKRLTENEQLRIDSVNDLSQKSKLRERDKESFRQFVDEADGDSNTHVFIDGAQLSLYMQDKTQEQIEADPALKLLSEQAREAALLEVDVHIPVADFAADLAGTDHFTELRDSMTMSTDTVSPFRQEQAQQETENYVKNLMEEAQQNTSEFVEAQEIYTNVREQLVDTGQVTPANASIMAQIVPAWATAQARRTGATVQEVYQDSGLVIEGPQTGERARLEGELVLTQEPAFKEAPRIFEAARDKFLEVLPEDATVEEVLEEVEQFSPEYRNFINALDRDDWLGFDSPAQAIDAALGEEFENFESSTSLKSSIGRLVNSELEGNQPFAQDAIDDSVSRETPEALAQPQEGRREAGDRPEAGRRKAGSKARSLFADMTREELITELLKHELTGIKGRKAFVVDVQDAPVVASIDADSLKWINDNLSPDHGDTLLQVVADSLESETEGAYHISGDEFYVLGDTQEEVQTAVDNAINKLSTAVITATKPDGTVITLNGLNITHGIGETKDAADQKLKKEKVRREETGERAPRGEQPLGSIIRSPEGIDPDGDVSEVGDKLLQPDTKEKRTRGYYDPANSVIRLNEAADLSTFLHEFGHFMYEMEVANDTDMVQSINNWYKRNAKDVAKEATTYINGKFDAEKQGARTSEKPVDIIDTDINTFLDEGTTGNKDKDSAIRRAVHEQFARGFETYLMEGKAPSIELRNAFRAFARWLSSVYQSLRGNLDVNLDNEMRQVFDRLLATEEQIAAAENRARIEPLFTDAAMAGMTEAEFSDYKARQEKVKDVQSETLRDKIIKQLTRQSTAQWEAEKQDIIEEEIEVLSKERVYKARTELKDGAFKIDHASAKEIAGQQKTDKRGRKSVIIPSELRGMTVKGAAGIHPDEAAAFLDYGSGAEMIDDLIKAPKIEDAAEVRAEAIMVERHGDILNDGTIQREADEAVQSEERGKLILHELKILARGTNAPTIDRATVKELAKQNIGKLSFRKIHPGKYRNAEIKAAQESTRMLSEGNKEGAASAKMRQVMNYYLGVEATNAKNDTLKIVDRMGRYNKKKVREAIMKVEGGYWDQIVKILDRFEFRKSASLKTVDNINLWAKERTESAGDGLVLSNATLNESFVTHWKNVPFEDLQGINDSVKNIEHVARYADKMIGMQEAISYNKLKSNWINSIGEQDAVFKTKETRSRIDDARKASLIEHIQRWSSQLTKIPFLASWLDGGVRAGISHDILIQPMTDALDAKMKMVDEVATPVIKAIANRSKEDIKRHNQKIFISEINDTLQGHQVLAVALNTGNQGNLKKMLLGEGWADPEVETDISFDNPKLQAILTNMTKSDWDLVQTIWDQMESLYPQLAEVHQRTTGLTPPKVEATPVETSFGTFRGGYYPVKYSPRRSHKAEKNAEKLEAETESMFNNVASIQASVNTGATNERTGFYDRILLSLDVVPDHFNETIHYITHHDAVRQTNKLIQSPDVASAITAVMGESEYKELRPWLNDVAKDGRQQPVKTYIDEAFQQLRFGTTLGVMGFKASTGIMQLFGILTTASELGVGPTIKGVQTVVGNAWYMRSVRKLLGSTTDMQSGWDFANERSKVLPHRTKTMDREIRNAMNRLSKKTGPLAAIQEASMKHIALIQANMVDLPTWHAAYDKNLSEFNDEAKAIRFADLTVENTQGSGATKDMARIMRSQSKIHSTFTMFMTFFSSLGNLSRDLVRGGKSGQYSPTTIAAKTMFLFTLPVFFEMLMRGKLDEPEDEDDRMSKFLSSVALYPVQSIPFIRDIASGALSDFGYNSSPVAAMMGRGITSGKGLVENIMTDEEVTKSQLKNVSKLAGAAFGIPGINQVWSTGEHLYDVIEEGEEATTRELLFGPDRE